MHSPRRTDSKGSSLLKHDFRPDYLSNQVRSAHLCRCHGLGAQLLGFRHLALQDGPWSMARQPVVLGLDVTQNKCRLLQPATRPKRPKVRLQVVVPIPCCPIGNLGKVDLSQVYGGGYLSLRDKKTMDVWSCSVLRCVCMPRKCPMHFPCNHEQKLKKADNSKLLQ